MITIWPDIFEQPKSAPQPVYNLILEVGIMAKLGIVLIFVDKMITIDQQELPT